MIKIGTKVWSFSKCRWGIVKSNINEEHGLFSDYPLLVSFPGIRDLECVYTEEGKNNKFDVNPDLFSKEINIDEDAFLVESYYIK